MSEQWNKPKAKAEWGRWNRDTFIDIKRPLYSAEINYSTLGSHSWKELKNFPPHLRGCSSLKTRAAAQRPIWWWRWRRERSTRKFPKMVWEPSGKKMKVLQSRAINNRVRCECHGEQWHCVEKRWRPPPPTAFFPLWWLHLLITLTSSFVLSPQSNGGMFKHLLPYRLFQRLEFLLTWSLFFMWNLTSVHLVQLWAVYELQLCQNIIIYAVYLQRFVNNLLLL